MEWCKRIGDSKRGEKHPYFGKPTPITGKHHSEETKKKMSLAHMGEKNSFFGKKHPPELMEKINAKKRGVHPSPETRLKMSLSHKGKKQTADWVRKRIQLGENNSNWRGGISFEPYCPKFNDEFKERVRAFFGHQCIECGTPQNGYKLHVHHVNFNKNTCCDNTIPLFVPLCRKCHLKTNINREYWTQHFTDIINQNFGGVCYVPKKVVAC